MLGKTIVVRGTNEVDEIDLRLSAWSLARDQRRFGPRQLVAAFAERGGRLTSFAFTERPDPPEAALIPCIRQFGSGASAAVAFCDEMIEDESPLDIAARFLVARRRCAELGVHLVDWFACDDMQFRSSRLALNSCHRLDDWWDVP